MSALKNRPIREDMVMAACLEAYGMVRHEGRLADRSIDQTLRAKQQLYSNERRAVAERVYALLRRQVLVDVLSTRVWQGFDRLRTTAQDMLRFAVSRVVEGETIDAVADALSLRREDAEAFRKLPQQQQAILTMPPQKRFAIESGVPEFLALRLFKQFGDDALKFSDAMATRAPLTARVNTLKVTREELLQRFRDDKIQAQPTPLSPFGIHIETRTNVYSLDAFRDGQFEVQDEGSQLLGMLVDGPPTLVIDACAGAGGKTLQIAAQMKNKGELIALDVDAKRLEELKQRARRAGAHNVRVHAIPPTGKPAIDALARWKHAADRVMVDAPCTGTGTWRRKPDARYKLTEASLAEHVERQHELLARFASMVKPGGRLIYGTCSILNEENEAVVSAFLKANSDYTLQPAGQWLPESAARCVTDNALRLYPHLHNTDGFYGAVMVKNR